MPPDPNELSQLLTKVKTAGWASNVGVPLAILIQQAKSMEMDLVRNRTSGPLVSVLEPVELADARERSLSAISGDGMQPLHTDGAHHAAPPDFVLLACSNGSDVATHLWRFARYGNAPAPLHDLQHGLFTVETGRSSFLAPALDGRGIRYDPGCMRPADRRAMRAAEYLDGRMAEAQVFSWDMPGLVLAIANRQVLHARGDASEEHNRRLERVALRVTSRQVEMC